MKRISLAGPSSVALAIVVVLGAALGIVGWSDRAAAQGAEQPALVKVEAVRAERLVRTLPVLGRFVARQGGEVSAKINGPVASVTAQVGDRLKEGDVIAQIDTRTLEAQNDLRKAQVDEQTSRIRVAQAELKKAQLEMERLDELRANKSAAFQKARFDDISQQVERTLGDLGVARAALKQARANLASAEIELDHATIRAPYPGVVTVRHISPGVYVSVGAPIVTLVDDLDLEIEADVPATNLASLEPGDAVELVLGEGRTATARVRAIVPEENPLTRTRPVRLTPPREIDVPTAANQSVTIALPVGEGHEGLTVHKDAVTRRGEGYFVYVVVKGAAESRPITIGEAYGSRFEVKSGLAEGDLVVIRGNERLRPGQPVTHDGAS
ncbi:MAG: efflux RND transporter periplasmic adaptor subunit [Rhodospirillaceae bacterium]|nr:efflux RND transporter periplasmic adaptor subunit [Rhodospirillaceae bacterium]